MYIGLSGLLNQMKLVIRGRKLYFHFVNKYKINKDMDWVIILPEEDLKTNVCLLLYLNLLVKQFEEKKDRLDNIGINVIRENEKFLLLVSDERIAVDARVLFQRISSMEILEKEDMEAIKKRYSFMPFNERTIVGTVKAINGSDYSGLLQNGNLCLAEIIAVSVIGITRGNYIKWKIPEIELNDLCIEEICTICREIYAKE